MERIPVDSSSLRAVGYDPASQTLEVEFTSGQVYQYFAVPETVYRGLLGAESKGRFFLAEVRDHYATQRVRR